MDLQVRIVQFLSQYAKFPTGAQHGKIFGDKKMAINAKADLDRKRHEKRKAGGGVLSGGI